MADMIPKNHILRLINKYVDFFIEVTKRPERLSRGWQISLIMPSNGLGLLFFKNNPVCFSQACV